MTHFGDTTVREVMVRRPDMVTIPAGSTVREALDKAVDAGLNHLPALDLTIDEITGVAHARDLLRARDADRAATLFARCCGRRTSYPRPNAWPSCLPRYRTATSRWRSWWTSSAGPPGWSASYCRNHR